VPWKTFRDELAMHFAHEIIGGKIAQHVIDDHYKGMWADLVKAAERASARRKRALSLSRFRKIVAKK
jgi:hypothetical protein